jgi:hypothetical protein
MIQTFAKQRVTIAGGKSGTSKPTTTHSGGSKNTGGKTPTTGGTTKPVTKPTKPT